MRRSGERNRATGVRLGTRVGSEREDGQESSIKEREREGGRLAFGAGVLSSPSLFLFITKKEEIFYLSTPWSGRTNSHTRRIGVIQKSVLSETNGVLTETNSLKKEESGKFYLTTPL